MSNAPNSCGSRILPVTLLEDVFCGQFFSNPAPSKTFHRGGGRGVYPKTNEDCISTEATPQTAFRFITAGNSQIGFHIQGFNGRQDGKQKDRKNLESAINWQSPAPRRR
jgi:hypothetical protein